MIKRKQSVKLKEKKDTHVRTATGRTTTRKTSAGRTVTRKTAAGRTAMRETAVGRTGGRKLYVMGAVGLVLLLLFSFYVPQLIFSLRDSYLCRDIVYEEQEDTVVTLMSAAYEPSLEQRLKKFVEGQERGRNFYVSAQEMEVTEELYQRLKGAAGILYQQTILRAMMETGAVSHIFLLDDTFTINSWKQYVVYSDEYTEGVNFIIWYLDFRAKDGKRLELLIDAEDAAVYALYAEQNILLTMPQALKWDISDVLGILDLEELWFFSNYYYQSISREEWYNEALYYSKDGQLHLDIDSASKETVTLEMLESAWMNGDAISSPDAKTLILHLLFSRQNLDFSFRLFHSQNGNDSSNLYPEFYMGIDSISELIPEFAERF